MALNPNLEAEQHTALNEISWGTMEGETLTERGKEAMQKVIAGWNRGETHVALAERGESPDQVVMRQRPWIEKMLSDPEELALVCTHGRALKILMCNMLGISLTHMDEYPHNNLGLYIVEWRDGMPTVTRRNCQLHLEALQV